MSLSTFYKMAIGMLMLQFVNCFCLFAQNKRPNIIFILTDDQRWDALGFAGNSIIQTPQIDSLALSGKYFKNAFSSTPICAASRASILTGLYERTHAYTFQKPRLKDPYVQLMYPKILKDSGYYVGFFGKLGVIIDSAHNYFDISDFYDRKEEFGRQGYYYKQINGDTVHLTQYTGFQARNFIKSVPADKPFCLSLSFSAPHAHDASIEQYFVENNDTSIYTSQKIPLQPLSDSTYFNQLPLAVREGYNRLRWTWRFDTQEKYQQMVRAYYQMISELDAEIGLIRKQLELKGLADNTVIIVMGDNGYFLGDRQLADKWLMYEPSIRIPLVIYDPRFKKPNVINQMVLNIDLPKTILEIAAVTAPTAYQGKSLAPLIRDSNFNLNRHSILIEHLWDFPKIPSSEGIRTDRWKYFRYRYINVPEELYDLRNDPLEKVNLAANKKYKKVLSKLRSEFKALSLEYENQKLCPDDAFLKDQKF